MQGELTDGKVHIYSDDISVARWLQHTIETLLHPPFADEGVAVLPAVFTRESDPRSTTVETIEQPERTGRQTLGASRGRVAEGLRPGRPSPTRRTTLDVRSGTQAGHGPDVPEKEQSPVLVGVSYNFLNRRERAPTET